MWQIVVTDSSGTYYPIAFFANHGEAEAFAARLTQWSTVSVEPLRSIALHGVVVPASYWRIDRPVPAGWESV